MSPSQTPAHVTRDIGDDEDIPQTSQAPALPGPSQLTPTRSRLPAALRHLVVDSPRPSPSSVLPGPPPATPVSGLQLPPISSLPLSSGSLVLPPLSTLFSNSSSDFTYFLIAPRAVRWSSPLVTPPQQPAPPSAPRYMPVLRRMAVSDPRTGLPFPPVDPNAPVAKSPSSSGTSSFPPMAPFTMTDPMSS